MSKILLKKAEWGKGPWQQEPDRAEWKDEVTGLPCLAIRNMASGNWCGYVGVPPTHPLYGKGYDALDIRVHGGLTYAAACNGHICQKAAPGEPDDVWWFGFDCAHGEDITPGTDALLRILGHKPLEFDGYPRVYRDLEYVKEQIKKLASQLFTRS